MKASISVYPGLGDNFLDIKKYIAEANAKKIKYIFISLHMPEANDKLQIEFEEILKIARQNDMKVIVDISKPLFDSFDFIKFTPYGIRLDYGFTDNEIVNLSKNNNYKIFLNASTVNGDDFIKLCKLGLNTKNVGVFHNFYPKPYSGLSYDYYEERNNFYKSKSLEILAFVCSSFVPRMPLFLGLPTIEEHRGMPFKNQIQELILMGTDVVCVGDFMASSEELDILKESENEIISFEFELYNDNLDDNTTKLLRAIHKKRIDESAYLIRSETSRFEFAKVKYKPFNNDVLIKKFDLTIDNENYLRYSGEMQIWLKDYKADKNINVIGKIKTTKWIEDNLGKVSKFKLEW